MLNFLRDITPVPDSMMQLLTIAILSVFLIGCSGDLIKDPYAGWSAEDFYEESSLALRNGEFEAAITYLENLEARFPFSPHSRQAQLDIAYAYYKFDEPESAIAAADRFIRINPRDPNVDYAWYLKGRADYTRGKGFLDSYFPRDMAQHDNKAMHDAMRSFSTLVQQFPDSRYATDAYQHMLHLRNKLAEAELHAANYYVKRKAWLAAAKRGQYVLENYPTTPASRDALKIMAQAYQQLGMNDLAGAAQLVLSTNQQKDAQQLAVLKETAQLDRPAYP